jgi:hypothetical protein
VTLNRDVFLRDPLDIPKIPNDGVTTIGMPSSEDEWDILRYELSSFVCKGEYERGLERILSSYLANLDEDRQPAVWVSGFYGSGKSHLVRTLEALWCDYEFPGGERARGLVTDQSESIRADLKELSTHAKRGGGLWSAAGTLGAGAGGSFRLAFLRVIFQAAGLPNTGYAAARFALWLKKQDLYDVFCAHLADEGKDLDEFAEFLVSRVVPKILLELIPDFAESVPAARSLLQSQFPSVPDISDDDMLEVLADVLELQSTGSSAKTKRYPYTLIVLDELQQFISDDNQRLTAVQSIVEAVTLKFRSRVLFVATGQSALQSSPILAKLQDRFTVRVQLSDVDVETVVREVVLQKRPDRDQEVHDALEQVSGEISRHLAGTAIQPESADQGDLVKDYPLLPTRRRFWERALRAIDRGTAGQLRSQLRVTFEAVRKVGNDPVGHVVPTDTLFDQKRTEMLQSGVLLREVDEIIQTQRDGTADGDLRARLLALIFLISRLPAELGIRATADTLADLAVVDLPAGSTELRKRIPALLEPLLNRELMQPDGEYRLQTKESAEWQQAFQQRAIQLNADDGKIASDRTQELRDAVDRALRGLSITQGVSKTARKFEVTFGDSPPIAGGANIPVWVTDGWSLTESDLVDLVRAAGPESPLVAIHLPKRDSDLLKRRLVDYHAATDTLNTRALPTTDEGREARRVIESIQADARDRLNVQVAELLEAALVLKAGGGEATGATLRERVAAATGDAAERLYPRFGEADAMGWGTVVKRASAGAGDALSALGYSGDVDKHPVCARVLAFVAGGKKGSEVQKHFEAPEFGWPLDAIRGALLVLLVNGHLAASQNAEPITAKQLTQTKIGVTDFRAETIILTAQQRTELRGSLQRCGIPVPSGEEAEGVARLLQQLQSLAQHAGGEPPAPEPPSTAQVESLLNKAGNERLLELWSSREELERAYKEWSSRRDTIAARTTAWQDLERLIAHGSGIQAVHELSPQRDAVREQRLLLQDPDPVPPLVAQAANALRAALLDAHAQLIAACTAARDEVSATAAWTELDSAAQQRILAECRLEPPPTPTVGDTSSLLRALDSTPLTTWPDRIAAVATNTQAAILAAAKAVEPKTTYVPLPRRTLHSADDVGAYVTEVRTLLLGKVGDGPVVTG